MIAYGRRRAVALEDARGALQHAHASAQIMGLLTPGNSALLLDGGELLKRSLKLTNLAGCIRLAHFRILTRYFAHTIVDQARECPPRNRHRRTASLVDRP